MKSTLITLQFEGVVEVARYDSCANFNTIFLESQDGYKLDLVARLREAVLNYGSNVAIRYYIAPKPMPKDEIVEGFVRQLYGALDVDQYSEEYCYSEYTAGVDYETVMDIGNHNLYVELSRNEGKYLHMEVSFSGGDDSTPNEALEGVEQAPPFAAS